MVSPALYKNNRYMKKAKLDSGQVRELPKRVETPTTRGESNEPRTGMMTPLAYVSIGVAIGAGAVLTVHKLRGGKQKVNSQAGDTRYVYFATDGRPMALPEKDVYAIKQMHDDGVLPAKIAEKFGLSTVMLYRIINSNVLDNQ